MSAEFRLTSEFRDLKEIAYERNASPEWRSVFEVKPSIGRIVKLRGRLPSSGYLPEGISPFERKIITLATIHHQGTFSYSSEDIATEVGSSKPVVCRVIKRVSAIAH